MVDFPSPSTLPIQPASRAIEDRSDIEQRQRKPRPARKPKKVEEVEDSLSDEQKHALDLDA
ncbi:MAG: hypothetical protein P8Z30_20555 [Acidobacteriota bacterium]